MTQLSTPAAFVLMGDAVGGNTAMWIVMVLVAVLGPVIALGWWRLAGTRESRENRKASREGATVVRLGGNDQTHDSLARGTSAREIGNDAGGNGE